MSLLLQRLRKGIFTFCQYSSKNRRISIVNKIFIGWQIYYNYQNYNNKKQFTNTSNQLSQKNINQIKAQKKYQKKWSMVLTIRNVISHIIRFVQLLIIFSPVILLYPFRKISIIKNLWMDLCVKSVETAGVVWIKIFQYLSHRRDIIGEQMAQKFAHLRQHAPQHSYNQTKKHFQKSFGKQITQVFDQFDTKPIASGSVSQVYKAKYKGNKVVVKVRHPGVETYIQKDVNILFFLSKLLSKFSPSFSLPITEESMKKTLTDQINFNIQKQNLQIFNEHFEGGNLAKFPQPFNQQTNQQFLVQTFVQGQSVTYYQQNYHPLNVQIARLGTNIVYQMFIQDNFIHADNHGGNILINKKQKNLSFFSSIIQSLKYKFYQLQLKCVCKSLKNKFLKEWYSESLSEYKKIHKILKNCKQKIEVNIMDAGMVIKLNQNDRKNFMNLIKYIICHQGQKCAQMVYNLSSCNGIKLIKGQFGKFGKFQNYFNQLKQLFSAVQSQSEKDIKGVQIFKNMLTIIRNNNMKLQGQFATLLTNMLMLETMAKNLDKDINVLKYAIPHFIYFQKKLIENQCKPSIFQ